jgi:hypothetical protein
MGRFEWVLIALYGALLAWIPMCHDARADEACRAVGDTVVCQRAGFDTLVDKCVDADTRAKVCSINLFEAVRQRDESRAAFDACAAAPRPVPPPPPEPSRRPLVAVAVAAAGAAAVALSATLDVPVGARAALAGAGVLGMGAGVGLAVAW